MWPSPTPAIGVLGAEAELLAPLVVVITAPAVPLWRAERGVAVTYRVVVS